MLLRQLEYLVALARERHFARAAEACYVSQPSLSAAIRKLEHELDVPIVRRGRRFEGLTPEGERVLEWAHKVLAERDALEQELSAMRGGLAGTLRMGAIPTALTAASLLTSPFCARHPRARIRLDSLSSREITGRLAEFELDVAMTYLDDDTLHQVRKYPLYEERYLLLTPDDGPAPARTGVGWAEVAALYAHLGGGRWSSVISHAWLHMFGVPAAMRVIPLAGPAHGPRVGLVVADRDPVAPLARALLEVARHARIRDTLDGLLSTHVGGA